MSSTTDRAEMGAEIMAGLYSNPPKIFLLNGPPRSGKDTGSEWLSKHFGGRVLKFANPIKRTVTALFHNGDRKAFMAMDTAELKDTPQDIYFGKSCRAVQIGVSENFLKPFFNDTGVFGRLLVNEIDAYRDRLFTGPFFISDSGFRTEAEVLIEKYGAENIFLLRLHRENHTFKGDSRGYITLKDLNVREFDITNTNDNLPAFYENLRYVVDHCLNPVKL